MKLSAINARTVVGAAGVTQARIEVEFAPEKYLMTSIDLGESPESVALWFDGIAQHIRIFCKDGGPR